MKKSIKSALCQFGLMLFLAMFTIAGKAQVAGGQYAMSISSVSATTNTIDVSLTIAVNSPSEGMRFGGFSTSINFNTGIINGGTISAAYVAGTRSNALSALPSNAVNVATAGTIRLTTATLSPGVDILPGTTLNLGTWRITNTNAWATGNANLWLQNLLVSGKTNSAVIGQPYGVSSGSSFTYTTTAGNPAPGVVLSHSSSAPYSFNVGQICATAASQTASAAVSCFGSADGSSTITLSPVPTHTSISYTVDGGSVQTATLSSGAFTITGLSAGTHEVVISDSGCGNVSATGVSVGTPSQLTNSTTASACGSYTWSVNGQTYTTSGTYTFTNTSGACPVEETLHLTIVPNTTNTTTVSACGSYTWAEDGQTYTSSGIYSVVRDCHTELLDLTINSAAISTQPAGNFICSTVGSTSSFSVAANITGASYTWEYRVVTAANPNPAWITISAANAGVVYSNYTSATLGVTKTTTLPAAGTQYRVTVSGACGTVTSDAAALLVITTVKAGAITSATSVCLGSDITLTLTKYAGTSFQWQSSPISTTAAPGVFTDIPGATGTSYTIVGATAGMDKSYRVIVTSSCNGTTATTATKTIKVDPTSVAGTITSGGGVVCAGSNGTLKVAGYVGKIQWQYSTDGIDYVNAPAAAAAQTVPFGTTSTNSTAATYLVTGISTDLYFRARLTSGTCSAAYTTPVHYTIGTEASVGTISAASTLICPASGTTLSLTGATGVITWEKATNLTTPVWTAIANSNVLSISTGNLTVSTQYRAKVTIGSCSTVYSNVEVVAVVAKPLAKTLVTNTTSPTGATLATAICTNSTVEKTLTVGAGYIGSIQWQVSTTSATADFVDIDGATSATYVITNPSVGANYYRVKMSNTCGVVVFGVAKAVYYKDCGAPAKGVIAAPFGVVAYPNPYTENFNLSLTTSSDATVGVSIYDMTGKLIDKREVAPSDVAGLQVGNRYPSGVYNVVVTQGSDVKTLRVIKR